MVATPIFLYSTVGAVATGNNAWRNLSPHGLVGFDAADPWLLKKVTDLPPIVDLRGANRRAAC